MKFILSVLNYFSRMRWERDQTYVKRNSAWFKDEIDGKGSWKL